MSEQEAQNPTTSPERLEELSHHPAWRILVARNPTAPAKLLETLATYPDAQVRAAVASNPNTPWQTLQALAWAFPHAFLHNPVGSLQLMVHPEQISSDEAFWGAVLREANIPAPWWRWLLHHPVLSIGQAMRLHVLAAEEAFPPASILQEDERDLQVLERLLTVASAQWDSPPGGSKHQSLAAHTTTSQQWSAGWWSHLAHHADSRIRWAAATNVDAPEEVLRTLAGDQEAYVRVAVAAHSRTPVDLLPILAQDWRSDVQAAVARNERVSVDLLRTLAQGSDQAQIAVAQNSRTPPDLLQTLAQKWDIRVKSYVAENPRTPGEVLHLLAQDGRDLVYRSVASNAQTPAETLSWLARVQQYRGKARPVVAENPQTPEKVLRRLARSKDLWARMGVACNEQAPGDLLKALAQDQDARVRQELVWNQRTPQEILSALASDQDARVRWEVSLLQRLLEEAKESEKMQPWRNKTRSFLRSYHFSSSSCWDYRATIGKQLETAAALDVSAQMRQVLLSALAMDWDTECIQFAFERHVSRWSPKTIFESGREYYLALLHPFLPALALQKLARSPSWEIRYLVASHGQTPLETRRQLSQDGNRYVRAMAQARLEVRAQSPQDFP